MSRTTLAAMLALLVGPLLPAEPLRSAAAAESLLLRYDRPAAQWMEALPIGNGNFGAMIFGRPEHEIMRLNHDEFWSMIWR